MPNHYRQILCCYYISEKDAVRPRDTACREIQLQVKLLNTKQKTTAYTMFCNSDTWWQTSHMILHPFSTCTLEQQCTDWMTVFYAIKMSALVIKKSHQIWGCVSHTLHCRRVCIHDVVLSASTKADRQQLNTTDKSKSTHRWQIQMQHHKWLI